MVTNSKLTESRMRKHLFGAASSPGCANYCLKHLTRSQAEALPQASFFVQNDFYVDDGLTSVETECEAMNPIRDAQTAMVDYVCINLSLTIELLLNLFQFQREQ